ncbi:hypothetical protein P171DRAFT_198806 [Karstenula rhodostoma CBS 690.94]|uniref:Uncharacterized protein n=1 Tax=Karstenula rhodostoma CBS 690.94 TaxID=1392251 RepID=A0A9P4UHM4_9PLEO|nr:hypothetical protein P171DRAFT_198806 [Karstenula rhodostoma CBS 690.94]
MLATSVFFVHMRRVCLILEGAFGRSLLVWQDHPTLTAALHQQRPLLWQHNARHAQHTACISTPRTTMPAPMFRDSSESSSWPCAWRLCARSQPGCPRRDSVPTVTSPRYALPVLALGLSFDSSASAMSPYSENCPTAQVIVKHEIGWRGEHAKLATARSPILLFQILLGRDLSRILSSSLPDPNQ